MSRRSVPSRPRGRPAARDSSPRATIALALVAGLAGASAASAGDRVVVPGTGVEITPPAPLIVAPAEAALVDLGSGARVHVDELPVPVTETLAGFTPDALAPRGVALLASAPVEAGIDNAVLIHAREGGESDALERWMLIGGDASSTVILTATLPEGVDPALEEAVRGALVGATRVGTPTVGAALPAAGEDR